MKVKILLEDILNLPEVQISVKLVSFYNFKGEDKCVE